MQFSAIGGVFDPQVRPSSKLYSILKPLIDAGGVTIIGTLHPVFTVGAGGASGKITTDTVLLDPQRPVPGVPAAIEPQATARTYRACTV